MPLPWDNVDTRNAILCASVPVSAALVGTLAAGNDASIVRFLKVNLQIQGEGRVAYPGELEFPSRNTRSQKRGTLLFFFPSSKKFAKKKNKGTEISFWLRPWEGMHEHRIH